jgi:hypothetical protein
MTRSLLLPALGLAIGLAFCAGFSHGDRFAGRADTRLWRADAGPPESPTLESFGAQFSKLSGRLWTDLSVGAHRLRREMSAAAAALRQPLQESNRRLQQDWTAIQPQLSALQETLSASFAQANRLAGETLDRLSDWLDGLPPPETPNKGPQPDTPISV